MSYHSVLPAVCPVHGKPVNRKICGGCNAAYQRGYLRRRAKAQPEWAIWLRAKKRADRLGLAFNLPLESVVLPECCPALGVRLVIGAGRGPHSPSLDRIEPSMGYVAGNCRVICDHANRIKGNLDLVALKARATFGPASLRGDYAKIVDYVDREKLLMEVRAKAVVGGRLGSEWGKVADFLEHRFRSGFAARAPANDNDTGVQVARDLAG